MSVLVTLTLVHVLYCIAICCDESHFSTAEPQRLQHLLPANATSYEECAMACCKETSFYCITYQWCPTNTTGDCYNNTCWIGDQITIHTYQLTGWEGRSRPAYPTPQPTTYPTTSLPTSSPTCEANHGIELIIKFDVTFNQTDTSIILSKLLKIGSKLVNDSNIDTDYVSFIDVSIINATKMATICSIAVLVCNEISQNHLLSTVTNDNYDLKPVIIRIINEDIKLHIDLDDIELSVERINIHTVSTTVYPMQTIYTLYKEEINSKHDLFSLKYVLFGIVCVLLLCTIILIVMYICMRKKKSNDKVDVDNISNTCTGNEMVMEFDRVTSMSNNNID
eukprot:110307_1